MKIQFKLTAILLVSLISFTNASNSEPSDGYTIHGTVKGLTTGWVKLRDYVGGGHRRTMVIDSTQLIDGKFTFSGTITAPDMVGLEIDHKIALFFLENSEISIVVDWTAVDPRYENFTMVVTGSKMQEENRRVKAEFQSILTNSTYNEEIEILRIELEKLRDKEDASTKKAAEKLQEKLMAAYTARSAGYNEAINTYITTHPTSPISVHLLGNSYSEHAMSKEDLKKYYTLFQGEAKETAFYKRHITKVYEGVFEQLSVGKTVPDFTLATNNGTPLRLKDVKAKYILVDFWASWCGPCRASFPHLKELYAKYKDDGFEVVGIGTADHKEKWLKAIEEDQLPWPQVFDPSEDVVNPRYGHVAEKYGVLFLPTTILIDGNGIIVGRQQGHKALNEKLKEVFGH